MYLLVRRSCFDDVYYFLKGGECIMKPFVIGYIAGLLTFPIVVFIEMLLTDNERRDNE